VNKQNMPYRSEANPNQMHVKPHYTQRVPVWSRISAFGVISPYFLEVKLEMQLL